MYPKLYHARLGRRVPTHAVRRRKLHRIREMTNYSSRWRLTELKVLAEALPKCGELTGSYHNDGFIELLTA